MTTSTLFGGTFEGVVKAGGLLHTRRKVARRLSGGRGQHGRRDIFSIVKARGTLLSRACAIAVILVTTLVYALTAPTFEAPDETGFRLPRLLTPMGDAVGGERVAATAIDRMAATAGIDTSVVVHCARLLPPNPEFAFGTNTATLLHVRECPARDYLMLRAGFALLLVGGFCLIAAGRPLLLASLVFPSALFYASQISTDAVNAIISILGGYLALRRRVFLLLVLAFLALANDRSAFALLSFAAVIAGCRLVPLARRALVTPVGAMIAFAVGAAIGMVFRAVAGQLADLATLYANITYGSNFGTDPVRQAGALFLSSWYLGGSMSFTAFYVEYAAFAALLAAIYLAPKRWFALPPETLDQIRLIVSATVMVMTAIVTIIQPLTQARYYMFFVPAVVCAISGALRVKPSALVLGFAGLDIAYALSAAAAVTSF